MTEANSRKSDFPIDEIFLKRWSARSFTGETMPEEHLLTMFEAARWSQSASNRQPWRYSYSLRGSASFERFLAFMVDSNREWSTNAAAVVVVIAQTHTKPNEQGETRPIATHQFDTGAATQAFTLQAAMMGYIAHPMSGVQHDLIREGLELPEGYVSIAMVAVGKLAPKEVLPEKFRDREFPSQRNPVASFAFKDRFIP